MVPLLDGALPTPSPAAAPAPKHAVQELQRWHQTGASSLLPAPSRELSAPPGAPPAIPRATFPGGNRDRPGKGKSPSHPVQGNLAPHQPEEGARTGTFTTHEDTAPSQVPDEVASTHPPLAEEGGVAILNLGTSSEMSPYCSQKEPLKLCKHKAALSSVPGGFCNPRIWPYKWVPPKYHPSTKHDTAVSLYFPLPFFFVVVFF